MSDAIPVRLCDGQVLQVPPLRLSWASKHPRLVELMDRVAREILMGEGEGGARERMDLAREFMVEVCKVCKDAPAELDADWPEIRAVHFALRGVASPDPTQPGTG